jgi:hypothetical protein
VRDEISHLFVSFWGTEYLADDAVSCIASNVLREMMDLEWVWNELVMANLRYYAGVCLNGRSLTTAICHLDVNWETSEYKLEAFPT